ncbi:MAG: hypothetical protein OXH76_24650 [Boseongicola sp.]|nr:hypothetical protein [Boseongicola sp.]
MAAESREVRVGPHARQPRMAELEEPFAVRKHDRTMPTPDELARTALSRSRIVEGPEARRSSDWD